MKTDHKDMPTQMTKQENFWPRSTARGESREEKNRRAKETWEKVWTEYVIKKSKQEAEESRQRKRKLQQHRPKKRQNMPKETTEMRTKTTSLLKNQVVRTHHTSQPKRSSREPTRKATSKTVFCKKCIFPLQAKTNNNTCTFLFSCRF